MPNEIAIRETYDAIDAAIGSGMDDCLILRFKEGSFFGGTEKTLIQSGTVFRVAPTSVMDGYIKWEDGRPVDERMREWFKSAHPIERNALGDLDESGWPDGKDPWNFTMYLALKDAEGVMYKFTTSSAGGTNAIRKLLRQWRRDREKYPRLVPVVALGCDSYEHRTHRTTIKVPVFEIVGWEPWEESYVEQEALPTPDPKAEVKAELNDEIPF